jgi:hypothetical protein
MSRAGFESAIPATKRPQTYTLDRVATGISFDVLTASIIRVSVEQFSKLQYLACQVMGVTNKHFLSLKLHK